MLKITVGIKIKFGLHEEYQDAENHQKYDDAGR